MDLSNLTDSFKKAIIVDIGRKEVYVIKNNKLKVYPKESYKRLLEGLNFDDLT